MPRTVALRQCAAHCREATTLGKIHVQPTSLFCCSVFFYSVQVICIKIHYFEGRRARKAHGCHFASSKGGRRWPLGLAAYLRRNLHVKWESMRAKNSPRSKPSLISTLFVIFDGEYNFMQICDSKLFARCLACSFEQNLSIACP